MNEVPIDETGIMILAKSGLYDAIMADGSRVDLYTLVYGPNAQDWNLSGGLSSLLSNIGSFAKKLVSKPLKAISGLAVDVASYGGFGPVGQIAGNVLEASGVREAISTGDWKSAQRNLRNYLQKTLGIMPTTDQAYLAYEQSILQSMADQYMTGQYGPGYQTSPDWMKYLPWGAVAVLLLILILKR